MIQFGVMANTHPAPGTDLIDGAATYAMNTAYEDVGIMAWNSGATWGWKLIAGIIGILLVIALGLAIAALAKYLFAGR